MAYHDPDVETLDRKALDGLQRRKLGEMLSPVLAANTFYIRKFAGLKFDPLTDPLERLPFTVRAELQEDQRDHSPYGSNLTFPPDHYIRLHQTSASSGEAPLRWLDTADSWNWFKHCWRTIYRAAGVQSGDRLLFPFSFGPFVGFWAAFESGTDMKCLTIAAGGMTTTARLRMILDNAVTVICCTPTYALRMAEVAESEGMNIAASPVKALIVAGEPGGCITTTRSRIESAWGARVFDHTGMTEIGSCSFECLKAPGGVHLIESEFIAEVIDPESGCAVSDGMVGELVLTNLGRVGSPLIRYRTGDQVRMLRRRCACGRWFARLEGGILGRSDDMLLIRGNNVFPSAIEEVVRCFPIVEFRITARQGSSLTELKIEIESAPGTDGCAISQKLSESIRDRFNFKPTVEVVDSETLPRYEMKSRRFVRE
jgi:phenylacetate-CoA ligase